MPSQLSKWLIQLMHISDSSLYLSHLSNNYNKLMDDLVLSVINGRYPFGQITAKARVE